MAGQEKREQQNPVVARVNAIVARLEQHPANRPEKRDPKRFASKVAQRLNAAAKGNPALLDGCGPNGYWTAYEIRALGVVSF